MGNQHNSPCIFVISLMFNETNMKIKKDLTIKKYLKLKDDLISIQDEIKHVEKVLEQLKKNHKSLIEVNRVLSTLYANEFEIEKQVISGDNFYVVTLHIEYPHKTTHEIVVGEIKDFPNDEKLKKEADTMVKNFLMRKYPNLFNEK